MQEIGKINKIIVVSEYYFKKVNNEYVFIFDKKNEANFLDDCEVYGYYLNEDTLVLYFETNISINKIIIPHLTSRSIFKIKRLSKMSFIEYSDNPFSYELDQIDSKEQLLSI